MCVFFGSYQSKTSKELTEGLGRRMDFFLLDRVIELFML